LDLIIFIPSLIVQRKESLKDNNIDFDDNDTLVILEKELNSNKIIHEEVLKDLSLVHAYFLM
jgi:hypothetical protein